MYGVRRPHDTSCNTFQSYSLGKEFAPFWSLQFYGLRGVFRVDLSLIARYPTPYPQLEFLVCMGTNSTGQYEAQGIWTPGSVDKNGTVVDAIEESQGQLVWITGVPFLWCSMYARFLNTNNANLVNTQVSVDVTTSPLIPTGRARVYGSLVIPGSIP